ncbi:unnamed protein product [Closterium sp. NIES-65]|nr:unnamed protein product [Closterium sp. NIES-65]
MGALEQLNRALREELQESLDKIETPRGQGEVLQREKEELQARLVRVKKQVRAETQRSGGLRVVKRGEKRGGEARLQVGVAEEKAAALLQQVLASQQAEFALKMQVVEQDRQRAALARELNACQAEQARTAAERDQFARETAQLVCAQQEARQKLVEEERAEGRVVELAAANRRSAVMRQKAAVQ